MPKPREWWMLGGLVVVATSLLLLDFWMVERGQAKLRGTLIGSRGSLAGLAESGDRVILEGKAVNLKPAAAVESSREGFGMVQLVFPKDGQHWPEAVVGQRVVVYGRRTVLKYPPAPPGAQGYPEGAEFTAIEVERWDLATPGR